MNLDALRTASALREQARDQAAAEVARCLALTEQARLAADTATARIAREMEAATRVEASDGAVEAFADWLPRGRHLAAVAADRAVDAEARLTVARAGLAVARTAVEAITRLIEGGERAEAKRRARAAEVAAQDALGRRPVA